MKKLNLLCQLNYYSIFSIFYCSSKNRYVRTIVNYELPLRYTVINVIESIDVRAMRK